MLKLYEFHQFYDLLSLHNQIIYKIIHIISMNLQKLGQKINISTEMPMKCKKTVT